jgi:predicted transcriptional regulator
MKPHFRTVGEVIITNTLFAMEDSPAYAVAMKLLSKSFQGLPVLDHSGKVVGKVTEIDLLKALKAGKDLQETKVKEIMAGAPPVIDTETLLEQAVEIMDRYHLIRLPVMKCDRYIGSVTRHDLLRAWLGVWMDDERGSYAEVIG